MTTTTPRTAANPQGPWEVAGDFHIPEGFSDSSYENDVNPSVTCDATGHTLYWDTESFANMRAEGATWDHRFFVVHADTSATLYSGNDLQAAIRTARGEAEGGR